MGTCGDTVDLMGKPCFSIFIPLIFITGGNVTITLITRDLTSDLKEY
jgi:hypothetical protein